MTVLFSRNEKPLNDQAVAGIRSLRAPLLILEPILLCDHEHAGPHPLADMIQRDVSSSKERIDGAL